MAELSLLDRSGTVAFLDFSILKVMVFSSALQLETCYGVVALSYLLSAKTYLSAKIAASSVAAGPCSNKLLLADSFNHTRFGFFTVKDKFKLLSLEAHK